MQDEINKDVDSSRDKLPETSKTPKPSAEKKNSSLKERLITTAVGLTMLVIWLFFFNTIVLNIVLSLLGVLLLYEMLSVTHSASNIFVLIVSFLYAALVPLLVYPAIGQDMSLYYGVATFAYLVIMFLTLLFKHHDMHFEDLSFAAFVAIAIPLSLSFAMRLREAFVMDGLFFFLLALGGAWFTDTASYFVGTLLGKHKLAPEISPKKTLEGFFGGLLGNILLCFLMVFVYSLFCTLKGAVMSVSYWQVALFGLTSALIAVLGDLSASLIKRQCGVKDYGTIMPGMGGGMDRFDSVLFVLPYTYFFLQIFPILIR